MKSTATKAWIRPLLRSIRYSRFRNRMNMASAVCFSRNFARIASWSDARNSFLASSDIWS